ncbi:MAG: hypothetical protein AABY14_00255 [Nanoarchaeota archaeon]
MISKEENDFLKEYAYGRLPLVQMIPVNETSFPLWDWEAKRFSEWQKEVNVDAKIKPSRGIYDIQRNLTIIVTYCMDYDKCPFLTDTGKCKIYNKKRAYVCRMYPFQRSPFLNIKQPAIPENLLGTCPVSDKILKSVPKDFDEMIIFLYKYFKTDSAFYNVVQNDIIIEWINNIIIELCKKNIINPAMNYPYHYLLKRIENSEKIDLTEFLVMEKIYNREEVNEIIKCFDDNIQAKEKIENYLAQKIHL